MSISEISFSLHNQTIKEKNFEFPIMVLAVNTTILKKKPKNTFCGLKCPIFYNIGLIVHNRKLKKRDLQKVQEQQWILEIIACHNIL